MKITVLDPAVENVNAGDEIISSAIKRIPGLGEYETERITTHRPLRLAERRIVSQSDLVVLGGTNAISSHMERFRQWLVDPDLLLRIRGKLLLLGVGWWQYQDAPCAYTRWLLRNMCTDQLPHSVRDSYTATRLGEIGIRSLMTSCPTMWDLESEKQRPLLSSPRAVITVTDYKHAPEVDSEWIRAVEANYSEVVAIGMGPGDAEYFSSLHLNKTSWGGVGVAALDRALIDSDFIGTRLHAGVFAIQQGRPSLVLSVDNRAREIASDTNLHVVDRTDVRGLEESLRSTPSRITLPMTAISQWTSQFGAFLS